MDEDISFNSKNVESILNLEREFDHRFADFKTHRATFQIFADPFTFDVQEAPSVLQMELIDLQCSSDLKAKFSEVSGNANQLRQFLRELPSSFPELSRMFSALCAFLGAHICVRSSSPF